MSPALSLPVVGFLHSSRRADPATDPPLTHGKRAGQGPGEVIGHGGFERLPLSSGNSVGSSMFENRPLGDGGCGLLRRTRPGPPPAAGAEGVPKGLRCGRGPPWWLLQQAPRQAAQSRPAEPPGCRRKPRPATLHGAPTLPGAPLACRGAQGLAQSTVHTPAACLFCWVIIKCCV